MGGIHESTVLRVSHTRQGDKGRETRRSLQLARTLQTAAVLMTPLPPAYNSHDRVSMNDKAECGVQGKTHATHHQKMAHICIVFFVCRFSIQ